MRTTLTLDADVAKKIENERRRSRRSLKEIVNDALRIGLASTALAQAPAPRFRVRARSCGFRPGVDPERLNQLIDQLEAEDLVSEAAEQRAHDRRDKR